MREDIPTALEYETRSTNNCHGSRKGSMFIILGQSGIEDYETSIEKFQDTQSADRRSPHFLIGRESGQLAKMADINKKAWFAGTDSRWMHHTNLNKLSIMVCLCATEGQGYTEHQYDVLRNLIFQQMKQPIGNHNPNIVLSHQDVRPWRHWGVGPLFEWYRLIQKKQSVDWKPIPSAKTPWEALYEFGYRGSKKAVITAFQTRFMASTITGKMDQLTENYIMGHTP